MVATGILLFLREMTKDVKNQLKHDTPLLNSTTISAESSLGAKYVSTLQRSPWESDSINLKSF